MSREEALDWLARSVHEWPMTRIACFCSHHFFERSEWQDRRAELQGKPSWGDAPEWAWFMSQGINGRWYYHEFKPDTGEHGYFSVKGKFTHQCSGEVLGDWRDTLERRPDNKQNTKQDEAHDEVNSPAHYDLFPGQQSIDVIKAALTEEEWRGFLKGNIIKYRLRAGQKGPADKCLAKADWYKAKLWGEQGNG